MFQTVITRKEVRIILMFDKLPLIKSEGEILLPIMWFLKSISNQCVESDYDYSERIAFESINSCAQIISFDLM